LIEIVPLSPYNPSRFKIKASVNTALAPLEILPPPELVAYVLTFTLPYVASAFALKIIGPVAR
jgi:hypothetical protein